MTGRCGKVLLRDCCNAHSPFGSEQAPNMRFNDSLVRARALHMSLRMHDVLIWHCRGLTGRCKTTSGGGGCCRTVDRARPGRSLTRQSCSRPATRPRRARRASSATRPGRTWRKGLCRSMRSILASRQWGFVQVRPPGQFSHSNRLRLVGCRYNVTF